MIDLASTSMNSIPRKEGVSKVRRRSSNSCSRAMEGQYRTHVRLAARRAPRGPDRGLGVLVGPPAGSAPRVRVQRVPARAGARDLLSDAGGSGELSAATQACGLS